VAALFAIHPLHVESVAWVSERKDVLSGVLFTLTLLAYARYARGRKRSSGQYLTVIALFALGLMCKPTLVTLPLVLLLLDYWPLDRINRERSEVRTQYLKLVLEKLPLVVLSVAVCIATFLAQREALDASPKVPLSERVSNAIVSYVAYLGQLIWPGRLAVLYPYHEGDVKVLEVIVALLLLLIISVVFFLWRRKYPFLLIGWFWYLGMLVPMIGIVQVGWQVRADRYTYLPQIGIYLVVAWGTVEWLRGLPYRRQIASVAGLLTVSALATRSYFQTSYWRSSETLWRHAVVSTSGNYIARNNLAHALSETGRFDEAIALCRKALEIKPDFAAAYNNLGFALVREK
jgi:protein O-mannosyl-transferase